VAQSASSRSRSRVRQPAGSVLASERGGVRHPARPTVAAGQARVTSAPPVSVVMTAYNREDLIAASIDSVLAQTFADFELVIVDDCSSDGTAEIARAYERTDARVRVVVNEQNLGDYPNRNRAASLVRGSLFKYHDSDDLMYPHCLAVM